MTHNSKEVPMAQHYDRKAEDLGNITGLEHVNLQIPDQALGTLFYIQGLGLTRDPYMNTGLANMWINVGKSQFHLPTGDPWVLRGAIGLVTPDRQALLKRLDGAKKQLAGPKFAVAENNDHVAVTCPWGNRFNMHCPDADRFGAINLGMPYLEFGVPKKTAKGIERFYRKVFVAQTKLECNGSGRAPHINVGYKQELVFRETDQPIPEYDGHHIPLYVRPLFTRNPSQSQQHYQLGGDAWDWELPRKNERLPDVPPPTGPSAAAYAKRRATRMARGMERNPTA